MTSGETVRSLVGAAGLVGLSLAMARSVETAVPFPQGYRRWV